MQHWSLFHLSWNDASFLGKLVLFVKSQLNSNFKSSNTAKRAEGYSALSSNYYSIAATTVARLRTLLTWRWSKLLLLPFALLAYLVTWLPLGAWCYWRMLAASHKVVELIGYEGMSADQCDIRQSILRRRGYYSEASHCITIGLRKGDVSNTTRCLLFIGLADVCLHLDGATRVPTILKEILALAPSVSDPHQLVRIYRNSADLMDRIGKGTTISGVSSQELREKAHAIAIAHDMADQLLKL